MAWKLVVVILVLLSITMIESHMMMNHPSVWGINSKKGGLEVPLNSGTRNWFMAGARKDTNSVLTLNAGGSVSVPVTCGEAVGNAGNAPSICKGDRGALHGGGGCALSISYKDANSVGKDDFTIFSVNYRCPNEFRPVSFEIPSNLPACDDCVCAWTWIPSETASADEMYMNGFNCRVESRTQGKLTGGPKLTYFAVPGSRNPGFRPRYNNNRTGIKDGAQQLNVSGGGSSNNNNNSNNNSSNNNNKNDNDSDNKSKGTCGNGKRGNGRCASGECCSQWGWCGTTSAHCQ